MLDVAEDEDVNAIIDTARSAKAQIVSIVPRKKRLEDLFIQTIGDATREMATAGGDQ